MQNYTDILNAVAEEETVKVIITNICLLGIVIFIWIFNYFYCKRHKGKNPKLYASEKQKSDRRKAVFAIAVVSAVCVVIGVIGSLGNIDTVSEINKDVSEQSYVTYNGEYRVMRGSESENELYNKWASVYLKSGEAVLIHIDSFEEYLLLEDGRYNGRIVYGENSGIVVEIE